MQHSLPQFSVSSSSSILFSHHRCTKFAFIAAGLPLLFCSSGTEVCSHCLSSAVLTVGVQAAPLLFWCIVWSSTDLCWHPYNQSCQLQLLEADSLAMVQPVCTRIWWGMAQVKQTPYLSSLPKIKMENYHSRVPQCCWIFLLPHGLDRSSMSGKLKLNDGQAKPSPFIQHAFKRNSWLHARDSLML